MGLKESAYEAPTAFEMVTSLSAPPSTSSIVDAEKTAVVSSAVLLGVILPVVFIFAALFQGRKTLRKKMKAITSKVSTSHHPRDPATLFELESETSSQAADTISEDADSKCKPSKASLKNPVCKPKLKDHKVSELTWPES